MGSVGSWTNELDLVYLWVDSADPKWRESFRRASGREAIAGHRFRSFDELRYSLRSVERHAPFVRRIYLVTASQAPAWLKPSARLSLVDHRDIFADPATLPVFAAQPIEAHMHRIPGLSDRFLYANDDTFFLSDAKPTDFFTSSGKLIVRLQQGLVRRGGTGSPWRDSVERSFELLAREYPRAVPYRTLRWRFWEAAWEWFAPGRGWPFNLIAHQIRGLTKEVFAHASTKFPDVTRAVEQLRFATGDTPNFLTLLSHAAIQAGLAEARMDDSSAIVHPGQALSDLETTVRWLEGLRRSGVRLLCVNDGEVRSDDYANYRRLMEASLERLYPAKSAFEI